LFCGNKTVNGQTKGQGIYPAQNYLCAGVVHCPVKPLIGEPLTAYGGCVSGDGYEPRLRQEQ